MEDKQKEAEEAVSMAEIGYMDALNLQLTSERISRGLLRMQQENHFGFRLFGVEE